MSHKQVKARLITGLALLCTGVIFGLILFAVQSNFSNDKAYAQNLIRLHVIAHSNAPADQDLKLVVRDAVLQEAEQIWERQARRTRPTGCSRTINLDLKSGPKR